MNQFNKITLSFWKYYASFFILAIILIFNIDLSLAQSNNQKEKKISINGIALPSRTPENGWNIQGGIVSLLRTSAIDTMSRKSNIYLFGMYSQFKQFRISTGGDIFTPHERFYIYSWIYFSYVPELFFGTGNTSFKNEGEFIEYRVSHLESDILYKVKNNLFTGLTIDCENTNRFEYPDSGYYDNQVTVSKEGYRIAGLGLKLKYDSRNNVMWPSDGWLLDCYLKQLIYLRNDSENGYVAKIDLRKYFSPIPEKMHVLTVGANIQGAFGNVPFRYLPSNSTRAYHPGLFRDNFVETLIIDYRLRLYRFIHFATFMEFAYSNKKFINFNKGTLTYSYGPGLRIKLSKTDELFLRLDYGIGNSSSNFHLSFYSFY